MGKFIAAIVAASTLLVAAESRACNPVQAITSYQSAALVAPVAVPVTYQPVVQAVEVAAVAYAQPVVLQQNFVVKKQRHRRQPVRNALQVVLPPYGCGR